MAASLTPEGPNYDPRAWLHEPGQAFHYSVSAYPLLRYLVARVSGQSYAEYMRQSIFAPLEMTSSGFSADEFAGRHAVPYTRIDGRNIDLPSKGHGLGLFVFRGGWYGNGGSAPGFQCLARFRPSRQVGYVILSNVNAILGGGANYESARSDVYSVQNALVSILDPTFVVRRRAAEILIVGGLLLYLLGVGLWTRRRRARARRAEASRVT